MFCKAETHTRFWKDSVTEKSNKACKELISDLWNLITGWNNVFDFYVYFKLFFLLFLM